MRVICKNPTKFQIGFKSNGDMAQWDGEVKKRKDNFFFEDSIRFVEAARGMSSFRIYGESVTDKTRYILSGKEILKFLQNVKVENGIATGIFTFRKGGQNYSLGVPTEKELKYIKEESSPKASRNRLAEIG